MKRMRAYAFASTAALVCSLVLPAQALAETRNFNVPAQPGQSGIPLFAHQAGLQIMVSAADAEGVVVNRVQGALDVMTALRHLLAGSNLTPVKVGNAIVLKRAQPISARTAGIVQVASAFGNTAAHQQDDPAQSDASGGAMVQEPAADIVVTGIRASLQESINAKRAAGNIVDVITAQDIGKLPDQNVAESMSRITGVQITRREGDGSNFTVRGISQNRLEINGRTFLGPGAGGSASLESVSPEIISSIVVAKSPSADMPEGALGATVNLKTKRPLDLEDLVVSARLQGAYTDQADRLGYRGSALISKNFNDRFGILASAAYSNTHTRGYSFDSGGWTRTNAIDGDGDGVNDPGLYRPNRFMARIYDRHEKRLTLNSSIQYRPADDWEVILDGTYSRLKRNRQSANWQVLLNDQDSGAVADENGTVVSGTFNNVTVRPLVYDEPTEFRSTNLGFSTKYDGEIVKMKLDASYSKGRGTDGGPGASFTYVVVPRAGNVANVSYDFSAGNPVPNLSLDTNFNVNDPSQYQLASIFENDFRTNNVGYDARVDFEILTNLGPLRSIEVGSRFEKIEFYSEAPQNIPTAASLLAKGDKNGDGILTVDELPGLVYNNKQGSFFPGVSGSFPRDILGGTTDKEAARDAFGLPIPRADNIPLGRVSIKDVDQDTIAFYAKANLETELGSMRLTGNVGVRYVTFERISSGFLSDTQPTASKSRFNYWLPSANASLDLTDKLTFRLAAAKVMARPSLSDVGVSFVPLFVSRTGSRGNPNLRPFEATQYDATLEWYFAPSSALTLAGFYKNVDSFTINLTREEFVPGLQELGPFQITQPVNGESGKIKGFEVAYQQSLRFLPAPFNNLGIQANYTFVDSKTPLIDEATQAALPLPGLSKHSYNLIGYYEDKIFSLRVAYIYRSKYLLGQGSAASGGSSYADGRGQLDASAQVNLTKTIRLTVEAINLTREIDRQYLQTPLRLLNSAREDRRFFFGIAATF
ncbi:TonB-dependent receptor [Sphingobium sp. BYY-5]|uniref:TonB-dependent receptor n=1 Tax=Sphingobium sp. BYY-5 TaxID=2926400 RepID=UPI001FA6E4DF|nr:TonB-dependent receptor [Sphingobium sp. BYY-5]MCI4591672.1 TonB-dependent receptor [Sphingobium sp. BYY-5]